MKCFFCKDDLVPQQAIYTVNLDNAVVIVKDVPALVCGQCGEVSYDNATAKQLEYIVDNAVHTLHTEVAVLHYAKQAA